MRPINKGLQRLYKYLINTPLVIKSNDVRKAYKAFIIYYITEITPFVVGLKINNTQAMAFQTKVKEMFDSFMSENWRHITVNIKTTRER